MKKSECVCRPIAVRYRAFAAVDIPVKFGPDVCTSSLFKIERIELQQESDTIEVVIEVRCRAVEPISECPWFLRKSGECLAIYQRSLIENVALRGVSELYFEVVIWIVIGRFWSGVRRRVVIVVIVLDLNIVNVHMRMMVRMGMC